MAAGDRTKTFPVDNAGNPEPVTVQSLVTAQVVIRENAGANTTSYIVHEPLMASPGVTVANGDPYPFIKPFGNWTTGDIVGYVEVVDVALATFRQEEK